MLLIFSSPVVNKSFPSSITAPTQLDAFSMRFASFENISISSIEGSSPIAGELNCISKQRDEYL